LLREARPVGVGRGSADREAGAHADALVTDVQLRAVVAGIRGLGRDGQRVLALGPHRAAAGFYSRFVTAHATAPDAGVDGQRFAETTRRLITEQVALKAQAGSDGRRGASEQLVVYPGRENSIDALSGAWDSMPPGAIFACVEAATLDRLRDKAALASLAEDSGVKVPHQLARGVASEMLTATLRFPCVVKPTRPEAALPTARIVSSAEELQRVLRPLPGDTPLLVQERAQGPLVSIAIVMSRDGHVVARFQQAALRTWPIAAGVSARAVSIAPDEELTARTGRLLSRAGFWGLGQLQFIGAGRDARLIDVNPRFFGSLPLALASGVNLPAAWHAVALGHSPGAPRPYRVGVTYRWLEGEIAASRRGERSALRPVRRPHVGALWAADDPLPSLILTADAVTRRIQRGL
jgi:predicted ATP-grasp superfamily ATP-dependent carboligase